MKPNYSLFIFINDSEDEIYNNLCTVIVNNIHIIQILTDFLVLHPLFSITVKWTKNLYYYVI
jgi:hypothetical protein